MSTGSTAGQQVGVHHTASGRSDALSKGWPSKGWTCTYLRTLNERRRPRLIGSCRSTFATPSSNGRLTDYAKLAGIRREQPGLKNVKTRTGKDSRVFNGSGRDPESRVRFPLALPSARSHLAPSEYFILIGCSPRVAESLARFVPRAKIPRGRRGRSTKSMFRLRAIRNHKALMTPAQ
jgi:hypothetical protein